MKWLSKVGQILTQAVPALRIATPIIQQLFPKTTKPLEVVNDGLQEAATVIVQVEAIGQIWGKTGADKLTASVPAVSAILMSKLVAGRKIHDKALFTAGATKIASGLADVLNSMEDNEVMAAPDGTGQS